MLTRSAKSGNKLSTFSTNFKQNMELRERCKVRLWIPKTVQRSVAAIESAAPAHGAPKASSAEKTQHPNTKRPDIRCEVFDPKDGLKIRCTECNINMAYGRWSHHVDKKHNANNSQDQVDDGNVEAENRPAPKKRAEPKKATKKVAMKEPKKKAKPGGK